MALCWPRIKPEECIGASFALPFQESNTLRFVERSIAGNEPPPGYRLKFCSLAGGLSSQTEWQRTNLSTGSILSSRFDSICFCILRYAKLVGQ